MKEIILTVFKIVNIKKIINIRIIYAEPNADLLSIHLPTTRTSTICNSCWFFAFSFQERLFFWFEFYVLMLFVVSFSIKSRFFFINPRCTISLHLYMVREESDERPSWTDFVHRVALTPIYQPIFNQQKGKQLFTQILFFFCEAIHRCALFQFDKSYPSVATTFYKEGCGQRITVFELLKISKIVLGSLLS